MRKIMNIFAATLVMLAAASCEKNETLPDNNSEGKVVTLKASINNGETRTSLGAKVDNIYPVLWSAGDAISVIQESSSYTFVLSEGAHHSPHRSNFLKISSFPLFFFPIIFPIFIAD